MKYPEQLNIAGSNYKIIYVDHPIKVDRNNRQTFDAEVDYWNREIRIWKNEKHTPEDVWWFILHEVLHVIFYNLKLSILDDEGEKNQKVHDEIDTLALTLTDFLFRNDLINQKMNSFPKPEPIPFINSKGQPELLPPFGTFMGIQVTAEEYIEIEGKSKDEINQWWWRKKCDKYRPGNSADEGNCIDCELKEKCYGKQKIDLGQYTLVKPIDFAGFFMDIEVTQDEVDLLNTMTRDEQHEWARKKKDWLEGNKYNACRNPLDEPCNDWCAINGNCWVQKEKEKDGGVSYMISGHFACHKFEYSFPITVDELEIINKTLTNEHKKLWVEEKRQLEIQRKRNNGTTN